MPDVFGRQQDFVGGLVSYHSLFVSEDFLVFGGGVSSINLGVI